MTAPALGRVLGPIGFALTLVGCPDSNGSGATDSGSGDGGGPSGDDGGDDGGGDDGGGDGGDDGGNDDGGGPTGDGGCLDPPAGGWNDCINGSITACNNNRADCILDGTVGVCTLQGCDSTCDCWVKPGSGDAEPACQDVSGFGKACVLDCGGGKECPAGMVCSGALGDICVYEQGAEPPDTSDTSGGTTGGGTSGGTTTGPGTSTGGGTTTPPGTTTGGGGTTTAPGTSGGGTGSST